MTEVSDQDNKYQEAGEEQLAALIKEAGEAARARKRKTMDRHFSMLRGAIAEGLSRRKEPAHYIKESKRSQYLIKRITKSILFPTSKTPSFF